MTAVGRSEEHFVLGLDLDGTCADFYGRMREIAVLQSVGFRAKLVAWTIVTEGVALATAGSIVGAGGAWFLYHHLDIQKLTNGMFIMFEVTPRMMGMAFAVAALLGLLAALLPMINVARKMEERYQIPFFEGSFYGIGDMSESLREIARLLVSRGAPEDLTARAEAIIATGGALR
mgnify:CR=1 FL=1